MEVLDLFSGIGGFSLAAEAMGWTVAAHCEFADAPTRVLKKRWPDVPHFKDVRELDAAALHAAGVDHIDVITGGFPCQDVSLAGAQKGLGEDDRPTRSGLFREIVRLGDELNPRFIVMENVYGLLGNGLDYVAATFVSRGWTIEWCVIPASSVGAPHKRERVWMVCHKGLPFVFGTGGNHLGDLGANCWTSPAGLLGDTEKVDKFPRCGYASQDGLYELPWVADKMAVRGSLWPTLRASEHKDCGQDRTRNHNKIERLADQVCEGTLKLNPDWCEPFMGYPIGWTNIEVNDPKQLPYPNGAPDGLWLTLMASDGAQGEIIGRHDTFVPTGTGRPRKVTKNGTNGSVGLARMMQVWPALRNHPQFDWEPPRVCHNYKGRADRIKMLGNTIVWQVAVVVFSLIAQGAEDVEAA